MDTTCSQCGYDLQGLPRQGACPECGQAYDVVEGTGVTGQRADEMRRGDLILARARTISLAVIGVIIFGLSVLLAVGIGNQRPAWVGAVLAGLFLLGALTSFLYEKD